MNMNTSTSTDAPATTSKDTDGVVVVPVGKESEDIITTTTASYTLPYYASEVDALHESIQRAIDLIQYYSEQTEQRTSSAEGGTGTRATTTTTATGITNNTTTNPDDIYQQLDTARNQITQSWKALSTAFHSPSNNNNKNEENDESHPLSEQEQIRIAYLNMITDSFGNVLERYHNDMNNSNNNSNGNDIDANHTNFNIDVLADCLQSGYDLLTQFNASSSSSWYDNDFVWNDNDDDDDNEEDDDDDNIHADRKETPHERHRQQLGFQEVH
jgi:hypothetical protein